MVTKVHQSMQQQKATGPYRIYLGQRNYSKNSRQMEAFKS